MTNPQHQIGDLLSRYQAGFNLLGRLTVLQSAQRKIKHPLRIATGSRLRDFADSSAKYQDPTMRVDFDLPSTGAIDYLRDLTPVTKTIFDGLTRQYKADAITVAGVNDQRIIQKVRDELGGVLTSGGTREDFKQAVNAMTDSEGVARITSFEIDTVFNTNVQKAYSAGRYEQMTEGSVLEALPFWQYWTVGDDRVRPEHRILDQFTAHAIDPVWLKIYPPCGFNCRCSVVCLLAEEAPEGSEDGGLDRLPLLAQLKVPQPGFSNVLGFTGKKAA